MKSIRSICVLLFTAIAFLASESVAFSSISHVSSHVTPRVRNQLLMGLLDGEPERKALTRESEPEEFFATNTDKMSDEEKLPIALAGLAAISLPFILGMVALYAAQG